MLSLLQYTHAGSFPVQDVRSFILESSRISETGSSDELQSMCKKAKELHLASNVIDDWNTVSYNDISSTESLYSATI